MPFHVLFLVLFPFVEVNTEWPIGAGLSPLRFAFDPRKIDAIFLVNLRVFLGAPWFLLPLIMALMLHILSPINLWLENRILESGV